jgi:hypothetical protein
MANAVVAFWTACIKELQRLADKTGDADAASSSAAVNAVRQHLADHFIQQPILPNAVWKKLVQDVQVTCALGRGGAGLPRVLHVGAAQRNVTCRTSTCAMQRKSLLQRGGWHALHQVDPAGGHEPCRCRGKPRVQACRTL